MFGSYYGYYRPVAMLSFAFDQWLWNGNPIGFHVTNLLLHLGVVLCLYFFFIHLVNWKIGFIASFLFASFAGHVENIAFISGRMDVLATLFMLLCLMLYFRRKEPPAMMLVLCTLFSILAFLSKELALVLPIVFVVTVVFFMPRQQWKKHFARGAFFISVPLVVYAILRLFTIRGLTLLVSDVFSFCERLLMMPQPLVLYVQLLIFPYNLNARHVILPPQYSGTGTFVAMLLILLCIIVLAVFAERRRKTIALGSIWFLIGILPVLNIIPLRGQVIAERFLYFPSAGLALADSIGLITRRQKHPDQSWRYSSGRYSLR